MQGWQPEMQMPPLHVDRLFDYVTYYLLPRYFAISLQISAAVADGWGWQPEMQNKTFASSRAAAPGCRPPTRFQALPCTTTYYTKY